MLPNVQNFLKDKLGITVDVVKSNAHADSYTGMRKLDAVETAKLQATVEECYATFTGRVAAGRKMTVEAVDEIGQGRVWTGKDALRLGLVDKLGHIDDALTAAAKMAKLTDYSVVTYPKQKSWFENILDTDDKSAQILQRELGDLYEPYTALRNIVEAKGIQARMPMELIIE